MSDLRLALRQHRRRPGFAATVVATLTMSLGATVAVFAVVNTVIGRALPYASPERLVWIASVRPDNPGAPFSLPEYMDYRSRVRTLSGLAAYATWSASIAGDAATERLTGLRISANAFDVLGILPAAGRLLSEADDRPEAPPVVVLSYRVWQQKFGGSLDVVGRTARINGEPYAIVGVLPRHVPLPVQSLDIVTPLAPDRDPLRHARNSVNFLRFFGRLAPDVAIAQAQAELTAICGALRQQFPVEYARKEAVRVDPLHDALVGSFRQSMLLLLAAVGVVLATAFANLVSLALVRANGRRAELSMRIAIGASPLRLLRQLSIDAALLAAIGGVLAWIAGAQAVRIALARAPASIPRLGEVSLDGRAAWLAIALGAVAAALLTLAPLSAASGLGATAVRPATRGAIGDRWNHRLRSVLVAGEIAAALVLVLATVILIRSLGRLERIQPGFDPDGVFQARVSIPLAYRTPDQIARFYERLSERIAAAPGVQHVGVISVAPMSGLLRTVPFTAGVRSATERDRPSANLRAISPGYLPTVRTRLLRGRLFTENDTGRTTPVALVSAALADRFLSGNPVGQQLLIDDNSTGARSVEIVGVVENVHHTALDLPPALDIYTPLRQVHPDALRFIRDNHFWMVRTDSDPAAFRGPFLTHLRAVDPDAALSTSGSMRQAIEESLGPRRFNLGLFGAFASTAVVLAVIGLYGLVSYMVNQRAQEIGVRLALGATPRNVRHMILRHAGLLGAAGVVCGVAVAAAVRPLVSAMVPSAEFTTDVDPSLVAVTAASLIVVVFVAAWLPARRAARIDPNVALRETT